MIVGTTWAPTCVELVLDMFGNCKQSSTPDDTEAPSKASLQKTACGLAAVGANVWRATLGPRPQRSPGSEEVRSKKGQHRL